jgi:hypothetical protein
LLIATLKITCDTVQSVCAELYLSRALAIKNT